MQFCVLIRFWKKCTKYERHCINQYYRQKIVYHNNYYQHKVINIILHFYNYKIGDFNKSVFDLCYHQSYLNNCRNNLLNIYCLIICYSVQYQNVQWMKIKYKIIFIKKTKNYSFINFLIIELGQYLKYSTL